MVSRALTLLATVLATCLSTGVTANSAGVDGPDPAESSVFAPHAVGGVILERRLAQHHRRAPSTPSAMPGAHIVSGCHTSPKHAVRCAARDSGASVRCCKGRPDGNAGRCTSICFNDGMLQQPLAPLTCIDTYAATAQQADTECAQQGLRLCTVRELAVASLCCDTGCRMDHGWAWSSEGCDPQDNDSDRYTVPAREHFMRVPQSENAPSMPACPMQFGQPCDLPFRTHHHPARGSECAPLGKSQLPPLVAHCIAGQARTFIEPAVYESIARNLLPAFGGRAATLLYLKTWSSSSKSASNAFTPDLQTDQLVWWGPATQARLLRALQHIRPQRVRLLHSPNDENVTFNPRCTEKPCRRADGECAYRTPAGVARHLGQIASSGACLGMIREHEAAHKLRFQYFVRSRPDLAYPVPVPPLCRFASHKGLAFAGRIDWWYVFQRPVLEAALDLRAHYDACVGTPWWHFEYESLLGGAVSYFLDGHRRRDPASAGQGAHFPVVLVRPNSSELLRMASCAPPRRSLV